MSRFQLGGPLFDTHLPFLALCGEEDIRGEQCVSELLGKLRHLSVRPLLIKLQRSMQGGGAKGAVVRQQKDDVLYIDQDVFDLFDKEHGTAEICAYFAEHICSYDILLLFRSSSAGLIDNGCLVGKKTPVCLRRPVFEHDLSNGSDALLDLVIFWLERKWRATPVWACILIGGKSSRMGRPKHLITDRNGRTWLENSVAVASHLTKYVAVAGQGELPASLLSLPRIADIAGAKGPMAGLVAALRWKPLVSWLLLACDMPEIEKEGLQWLLNQRKPGVWGIVPYHPQSGYYEALLAYYDFRSRALFEKMLSASCLRIGRVVDEKKIATPTIPSEYLHSWTNCNTPDDLNAPDDRDD